MPCERTLSVKEPKALAALFVQIQEGGLYVAKVGGEGDMLLFDMKVFHLWLHEEQLKWSRQPGEWLQGVKHWICQSRISLCSLPLNLAANLTTGGRAWLQSRQTLEQKQLCSHVFIRMFSDNRSTLKWQFI